MVIITTHKKSTIQICAKKLVKIAYPKEQNKI